MNKKEKVISLHPNPSNRARCKKCRRYITDDFRVPYRSFTQKKGWMHVSCATNHRLCVSTNNDKEVTPMAKDKKKVKTPTTKKKEEAIKHCKPDYGKNTNSCMSKCMTEKFITKEQSPIIKQIATLAFQYYQQERETRNGPFENIGITHPAVVADDIMKENETTQKPLFIKSLSLQIIHRNGAPSDVKILQSK